MVMDVNGNVEAKIMAMTWLKRAKSRCFVFIFCEIFRMSTTLSLFKNGWAKAPFDGSGFINLMIRNISTFPDTTADGASQLYLAKNGVYILFTLFDTSNNQYRFLEPTAGQITTADDAWLFDLGTVTATMQVYPFIFGTNNGQQAVCNPFAITDLNNVSGTNAFGRLFITNLDPFQREQVTSAYNAEDMQDLLPSDSKPFPYVLTNKTTIARGDFAAYEPTLNWNTIKLRINLSDSIRLQQPVIDNAVDICFVLDASDPQPVTVADLGFNPSMMYITTGSAAAYTLNTAVTLAEKGIMAASTGNNGVLLTINDYATQPSGVTLPPNGLGVAYNSVPSAELPRITADPLPRIANLQTVQRNLQTLYDQIGSAMVEVRGDDTITRQYFATGDLADRVWTQMRDELTTIVGEGAAQQSSGGDTEIIDYSLSLASDSTTTPLQVTIDTITYDVYIEYDNAYYLVQTADNAISGIADAPAGITWDTITGESITVHDIGSSKLKLFFNSVMCSITTDWTLEELKTVSRNLEQKTVVSVGGTLQPLIVFKNVQPSLILVPHQEGGAGGG